MTGIDLEDSALPSFHDSLPFLQYPSNLTEIVGPEPPPSHMTLDDEYEIYIDNCNISSQTAHHHHSHIPPTTGCRLEAPSLQHPTTSTTPVSTQDQLSSEAFLVSRDFIKGQYCFTKHDRAMMRLYNLCDQAGSPRYLMDQVISQLNTEITKNQFDPCDPSITQRTAFMARMHRKFPSPPPERIEVKLESFSDGVVVYRFDALQQLKHHLM